MKTRLTFVGMFLVIGLFLFAQTNYDIYLYNGFDQAIYAEIVFPEKVTSWDGSEDVDFILSDTYLLEPGEEAYFGTVIDYVGFNVTCFDEDMTEYLIEPDTYYEFDGSKEYYATRILPNDFLRAIPPGGTCKWREVLSPDFVVGEFEGTRKASILNDTDLDVSLMLVDDWELIGFTRAEASPLRWITLDPGESYSLGKVDISETEKMFYGYSRIPGGFFKELNLFYTDILSATFAHDVRNAKQLYKVTSGYYNFEDNYSDVEIKLSEVPTSEWILKLRAELSYGEKMAISYYREGHWHHEVYRDDFDILLDSPEVYYVSFDGDTYTYGGGRSASSSRLKSVLNGSSNAKDVVGANYFEGGSAMLFRYESGKLVYSEDEDYYSELMDEAMEALMDLF
jgi:hypothetical protein